MPLPPKPSLRLRLLLDADHAIGPGKIDLLETIAATGSIAAAGRSMGMSYKRAWQLIADLNTCFAAPLVETSKGGESGGGAKLTPAGVKILTAYRRMEHKAQQAASVEMKALMRLLKSPRSQRRGA